MKKVYLIAAALAVAAGLIVFGVIRYWSNENERQKEENEAILEEKILTMTDIVTAARDIPEGTVISADMLNTINVDRAVLISIDAATEMESVIGRTAIRNFSMNEPIVNSGIATPTEMISKLSSKIPAGYYAAEIKTDYDNSVAGHIETGDFVDVMYLPLSESEDDDKTEKDKNKVQTKEWETVCESIQVIYTGSRNWEDDGYGTYDYAILAADKETIIKILNAEEVGTVKLILSSSRDETD